MKLRPVELLSVYLEFEDALRLKVGRLASKDREILFEYDRDFIGVGLEISPRALPLRPGVATGDPRKFDGLPGVFDDSLPDGWGRLLIDRAAAKAGIARTALSPLDRLALIGAQSMGALIYEPELGPTAPTVVDLRQIEQDTQSVLQDAHEVDLDRLIALGGSPHGARPKALVQLSADGRTIYGDSKPREGCVPYLVKFRAVNDDAHAGTLEHAHMRMAAAAGINVPPTLLIGKRGKHPGYFAVRRFDRDGHKRLHLLTLAGLLDAPLRSSVLSYRDLLVATREITRDERAVAEMFRRACFNVFAHNRDDHARNFSFLMNARGEWSPSPAYDLTFSDGPGGEHTLPVDMEGKHPTAQHLERLAASVDLKSSDVIIEDVRRAVSRFDTFADEAGLPARKASAIKKVLLVSAPAKRHRKR